MADHKSAQERPAGKREAVDHVEIGDATGAFLRAGRVIDKIHRAQIEPGPEKSGKHLHHQQIPRRLVDDPQQRDQRETFGGQQQDLEAPDLIRVPAPAADRQIQRQRGGNGDHRVEKIIKRQVLKHEHGEIRRGQIHGKIRGRHEQDELGEVAFFRRRKNCRKEKTSSLL